MFELCVVLSTMWHFLVLLVASEARHSSVCYSQHDPKAVLRDSSSLWPCVYRVYIAKLRSAPSNVRKPAVRTREVGCSARRSIDGEVVAVIGQRHSHLPVRE